MDSALGGLNAYFDGFVGLDHRLLVDNARAFLKI